MTTKKCRGIGIAHYSWIDMSKTNTDESCRAVGSHHWIHSIAFDSIPANHPKRTRKNPPNKIPVLFLCPTEFMNFMVFFLKQPLSNSPQNPRTKPGCFPGHHQQHHKLPSHQCMCSTIFGINWGRGVSTRTVDGGLDQRSRVVFTVSSTSSAWWLNVSTPLEKICTCKLKIGNHETPIFGVKIQKNLWNHHLLVVIQADENTLPETNSERTRKYDDWNRYSFPFGARPIFRGDCC